MAELLIDGDDLIVHLRMSERFWSFHGDVRAPLTAVTSVAAVTKPWFALRGWRMAGIAVRGVAAMGTWKHADGFDFCLVRRQLQAVQIDVATGRFCRYLICVPEGQDPEDLAGHVAQAAGIAKSPIIDWTPPE